MTRVLRRYPRAAGVVSAVVGVAVVVSWWLGPADLTSVVPGRPSMVGNTAIMALLAGASLFLLAPPATSRANRIAGGLLAAVTCLVAGLTLVEYVGGLSLGIDQLVVRGQPGTTLRGRPSPHSASAFLLVGAALLYLDRRSIRRTRPADILALAAGAIPLTALLGYVLSVPAFYGVPSLHPHTGMAVPTVAVLLILSTGILAARPDVGLASIVTAAHAGGMMARRLVLALLALVPAAILLKVGERLGWWQAPLTAALLIVYWLAQGVAFVLVTANRLGRDDVAARREREKLDGIVSIATDAIVSVDKQQRITLYNRGAEQIFGWSASEVMGKPLDILLPDRFRPRHRKHVQGFTQDARKARTMGEGVPAIVGLRKNGEEFRAEAAISRIEIDGERIYTAVLRDVGEQVRALEEQSFLARVGEVLGSSLGLDETLEHVSELAVSFLGDVCAVDVVEEDGALRRLKVCHADPAKAALVEGAARNTVDPAGPQWKVLETKQSRLVAAVSPDQYRSSEHAQSIAALGVRSIIAVPLVARGHLTGVLSIASCRPERRYGPADLRLAEELGRRVALALDNAHLYSVAQDAVEVRDRVLGVVAHDLRNPLNAILLNSELLRQRSGEPERRSQKPFDAIRKSALRMSRLIQDLLEVMRLESGHLVIERQRIGVHDLVAEAVEAARQAADEASVDVRTDIADGLPPLLADRDRLLQVLDNLIGNALKFTAAGGAVTLGVFPKLGETLFLVSDTGPGIAEADLPHVFDRFWQASKSDRRGAGLGLPIVKGIVEAHGGRVWVESQIGAGTTFFFTLPTPAGYEMRAGEMSPSPP